MVIGTRGTSWQEPYIGARWPLCQCRIVAIIPADIHCAANPVALLVRKKGIRESGT
jgi:hypothetical protein